MLYSIPMMHYAIFIPFHVILRAFRGLSLKIRVLVANFTTKNYENRIKDNIKYGYVL